MIRFSRGRLAPGAGGDGTPAPGTGRPTTIAAMARPLPAAGAREAYQ